MSGLTHEEYLKRLFADKERRRLASVAASDEEKLEAWVRLLRFVNEIKAGHNKRVSGGTNSA